jgi:hypothetical protein
MLNSIDPFYQEDAAVIIQLVECSLENPCDSQPFNIPALERAFSATYQTTMAAPITRTDNLAESLQQASNISGCFDDTVSGCSLRRDEQPTITITPPKDPRLAKYERLETFMKSCCMGLLEVSPPKFRYNPPDASPIDITVMISDNNQFPTISYIHATARDFVRKPETWAVIRKNAVKRVPPELSILMSYILQFKIDLRKAYSRNIMDHVIKMTQLLGQRFYPFWVCLLDQFDRIITQRFQDTSHKSLRFANRHAKACTSYNFTMMPVAWKVTCIATCTANL